MSRLLNEYRWVRVTLAIVAVIGQLFSFMPPAQAEPGEPGPYGRPLNHGYFYGALDPAGRVVIPGGLFPGNLDQFINAIRSRALNLGGGWSLQDIRGAQFIVQTMRNGGHTFPSVGEVDDWERKVRGVAAYGGVNLDEGISYRYNSYYQDAHGDNAFYTRDHGAFIWYPWTVDNGVVGNSITFRDQSGNIIYAIRKACGNPVGHNFGPLPDPWQVAGSTTISGNDQNDGPVSGRTSITSEPGQTVRFSHVIRLNGGSSQQSIDYTARRVYPGSPDQPVTNNSLPRANPGNVILAPNTQLEVVRSPFTIPLTATPGTTYCQYISFRPASSTNNGIGLGAAACVTVAYSYSLSPSAQVSQTTAAANETVNVNYTVNKTGLTISRPTFWAIKELVVQPGATIDLTAPYTDNNFDCSRFNVPGVVCRDIYAQPGTTVFTNATTPLPANPGSSFVVGSYPTGTRICRMLAVDPPTHGSSPRHRWSTPSCVTVGKRPTVHFMGGDISVGGGFVNSSGVCSQAENTGNIFTMANADANGSIVEYAAVARGKVQQFGTASKPDTAAQHFMATALMFANIPLDNPGHFGDNPHCITDYYAKYEPQIPTTASPAGPIDIGGLVATHGVTRAHYSGDLTIARSTIPKGAQLLIVVDGNVTIADNITYDVPYSTTTDIPSLAIVAKGKITINSGVQQIDGAFFTREDFATCDTPGALTASTCNTPLVVNGLVIANTVSLRRTAGADVASSSDPAERFFYGSELFFNNVLMSSGNSDNIINTIEEQDLPPRY